MRILMVSPEANPFARSGGLAEVVYALAWALVKLGHQVSMVLPLYRQVRESGRTPHLHRADACHSALLKDPVRRDLYHPGRPQPEFLLHRPGRPV